MSDYKDRFGDTDLDWLTIEDREEEKSLKEKGRFIQDPQTGQMMGSEPGPDEGGIGTGGSDDGSEAFTSMGGSTEGKVKGVSDFNKDDVGVYYKTSDSPEKQKLFIDTWNKYVDKTPAEFKKEYMGGGAIDGKMTVSLREHSNVIDVSTRLKDEDSDDIGRMDSSIFIDENRVHMNYYTLDDQAHGVMKSVMAHEMAMWEEMGITKVDLLANLEVGGYAWARYGFEPTKEAWRELSSDLRSKIERLSAGGSGEADSWNNMSDSQRDDVESAFYDATREEFNDSEVESWRDSGSPVEDAKDKLADEFNSGGDKEWATTVVQNYIAEREEIGEPVPFQADSIINAIDLDYGRSRGVDITFDNEKLTTPVGIDTSPTLPGVPVVEPHEHLTEQMRDDITRLLDHAFDTTAESKANDAEPPDYLLDSANENQRDHWDGMSDEERFDWAESNRPSLIKGGSSEGTGEIPEEEANALVKLTNSADPKAVWAIADSNWGKKLLLGRDWDGHLEIDNPDHMTRFNAYVGKAK